MPKYVIEREMPGAGELSAEQLRGAAQGSCGVIAAMGAQIQAMGPQIQWQESDVTGDKLYCVYIAPDEEAVREHARAGGLPADRVSEIKAIIDPTTAEG
jgi:hypothetical protein